MPAPPRLEFNEGLDALRAQRAHLKERLNKGCDLPNDLADRVGQESSGFDRNFVEWLRTKDEYERLFNQTSVLEASMQVTGVENAASRFIRAYKIRDITCLRSSILYARIRLAVAILQCLLCTRVHQLALMRRCVYCSDLSLS